MAIPSVHFYPLPNGDPRELLVFACRLTEKACQAGHAVHLLTRSEDQSQQLDELLWQFRADSFLPHRNLAQDQPEKGKEVGRERITLGTAELLPAQRDVLINLTDQIWDEHRQFADIRELIANEESALASGRVRFRYYRNHDYPIQTMKLSPS